MKVHLSSFTFLFALLLSFECLAVAPRMIPLTSWYSGARGDNFATSQAEWLGVRGSRRNPGYGYVRVEGQIFSPTHYQPYGTVPLYSWYSPSRGDNFVTSNPAWAGRSGDTRSGYYFVRKEGYIYSSWREGTVRLQSLWSSSRGDNFTTSNPSYTGTIGSTRSPDYKIYRTEGYILKADFGFGTMRTNDKPVRGKKKLLVVHTEYADTDFDMTNPTSFFRNIIGNERYVGYDYNLVDYLYRNSGNNLHILPRYISPIKHVKTVECAHRRFPCAESGADPWRQAYEEFIDMLSSNGTVNFDDYDTNSDGIVDQSELYILFIDAVEYGYPFGTRGGVTRGFFDGCHQPQGAEVRLCTLFSAVGQHTNFETITHEVSHQFNAIDLYGARARMSQNLTMMDATIPTIDYDHNYYHFDPWHKIKLAWEAPGIIPLSVWGGSGYEYLINAGRTDYKPIIFYNPGRGSNEYFIVEARGNVDDGSSLADYDKDSASQIGVAIWHVRTDANKNLFTIRAPVGGIDPSVYHLGAPSKTPGGSQLWRASNGEIALNWADGSDSRLRIEVLGTPGAYGSDTTPIRWRVLNGF